MKHLKVRFAFVFVLSVVCLPVPAQSEALTFADEQQKLLYHKLIKELRCLVCQNQNLADSNADLAQDLRQKSYDMVREGKDYDEIVGYMVDRYGDFVIYRPPLNAATLVLWFSPFALIVAIVVLMLIRIRRKTGAAPSYDDQQLEQARKLLDNGPNS